MSEYIRKRVEYINSWPNCEPFDIEKDYKKRVELFKQKYERFPYQPMQVWENDDVTYNKTISFIIDALEMIEQHPDHAYAFTFRAIDVYGKCIFHRRNETKCLKKMAKSFARLTEINGNVSQIFNELFNSMPFSVAQFLYSELFTPDDYGPISKTYMRMTTNENESENDERKILIDQIFMKFGYDSSDYANTIRKGSSLLRKVMYQESIELDNHLISISMETKMHLLLSGILYSLRNDYMHGLSISGFKSSKASIERYAMYYYCFLSASVVVDILLIMKAEYHQRNQLYQDLVPVVRQNLEDMKLLFGSRLD